MRVAVQIVPSNDQLYIPITNNFRNDNSPAPSHALSVKKTFLVIKETSNLHVIHRSWVLRGHQLGEKHTEAPAKAPPLCHLITTMKTSSPTTEALYFVPE